MAEPGDLGQGAPKVKFYSAEDIENLAAQGQKELILDETVALTDLARDVARQLGITLTNGSHSAAPNRPPASSGGSRAPATQLGTMPKGCQHGPLTSTPPAQAPAANGSTPIVDRLVGMVKQIAKRSGN